MRRYLDAVKGMSSVLAAVAGTSLTALMLLTIADVVLRMFGRPIVGTYELVAFGGALTAGMALPLTSWKRGHIYVDSFIAKLPSAARAALSIVTRVAVLVLFFLAGWNLLRYAGDLRAAGEVSATLRIPFYPVAAGVGVSCFVQCLVMSVDIIKILRGEYE